MNIFRILLLALVLTSMQAGAREVPVVNFENLSVTPVSGKRLSAAEVGQVIRSAAAVRNWAIVENEPGVMLATQISHGSKHIAIIEIRYSADKYSLTYKDSSGLEAVTRDGKQYIHSKYVTWATNLKEDIFRAFLKA